MFCSNNFKDFKNCLNLCVSSQDTPHDDLLKRAMPVLTERLNVSFQSLQGEQRNAFSKFSGLENQFMKLNQTVQCIVTGKFMLRNIGDCLVRTGEVLQSASGNTEDSVSNSSTEGKR